MRAVGDDPAFDVDAPRPPLPRRNLIRRYPPAERGQHRLETPWGHRVLQPDAHGAVRDLTPAVAAVGIFGSPTPATPDKLHHPQSVDGVFALVRSNQRHPNPLEVPLHPREVLPAPQVVAAVGPYLVVHELNRLALRRPLDLAGGKGLHVEIVLGDPAPALGPNLRAQERVHVVALQDVPSGLGRHERGPVHLHDTALGADDVPESTAERVYVVLPNRGHDHRGDGLPREDVCRVALAPDAALHHRHLRAELPELDHRQHGEDLKVRQRTLLLLLRVEDDPRGFRVDLPVRRESGGWIEMGASFVERGVGRDRPAHDALGDGVHVRRLVRRGVIPGRAKDAGEEAHGAPLALGARDVDGLEPRAPSRSGVLRLLPQVRLSQRA